MPESRPVKVKYSGTTLLEVSLLNKGLGFSPDERDKFHLHGLIPQAMESIEQQAVRSLKQYQACKQDMEKHIFLRRLQDKNETLFYYLVKRHLREMLPILYTPVVGQACEKFSEIYRANRGIFVSYPNRDRIDEILSNVTKHNVKVIVVTDGERILGLGDQGIGGMGIPIGKLSLYTACGGISPAYTLPVVLDVGTNNDRLLNDPIYMGWRNRRVGGEEYEKFVDQFVRAVKRRWPNVLLQFEDFALKNAQPILRRYHDQLCCFNDDIQGTAAVTLGCLIAASRASGKRLRDQNVVFLGAGSAGCGIAEQIISYMVHEGSSEAEARARVFMVDRYGLLTDKMSSLLDFQAALAQKSERVGAWAKDSNISLLDTVKGAKPGVLIGASGQPGLFTEDVIRAMHEGCPKPIVMPLSNPTSRAEAHPEDIIRWTKGAAIIAKGSPFAPVVFEGKTYDIAQCNNCYIFPGIGLGILAAGAKRVTDEMLLATSRALAETSPLVRKTGTNLLADIETIDDVSRAIALAVGKAAIADGVAAKITDEELKASIEKNFWLPEYREYTPA